MTDDSIISLLNCRDEAALSELKTKYGRTGRHIATEILRNEEDAREIFQDALMRIWEEEVPEVGNTGPAEVGEAEALDCGLVVLVSSGAVIVLVVGVWTDLDASVGYLGSRITVAESVGSHERIDVVYEPPFGEGAGAKH